jgi:hypothetical protein
MSVHAHVNTDEAVHILRMVAVRALPKSTTRALADTSVAVVSSAICAGVRGLTEAVYSLQSTVCAGTLMERRWQ